MNQCDAEFCSAFGIKDKIPAPSGSRDFRPIRHISIDVVGRTIDVIDDGRKHLGVQVERLSTTAARHISGELFAAVVSIWDENGSELVVTDNAQWRIHAEEGSCQP